jgi:hypothetical protein
VVKTDRVGLESASGALLRLAKISADVETFRDNSSVPNSLLIGKVRALEKQNGGLKAAAPLLGTNFLLRQPVVARPPASKCPSQASRSTPQAGLAMRFREEKQASA